MSTTLFIGNLAYAATDDDLFNLFVESNLSPQTVNIQYGDEGRSRGYGLATFQNEADADNAIAGLNGISFQDRNLIVRADRGANKKEKRAGGQGGRGEEKAADADANALFCGNQAWETTAETVQGEFAQFNPVAVDLKMGRDGRSRGFAIITFADVASAQAASDTLQGHLIDGRDINLRFDRGTGGGPGARKERKAEEFDDSNCTGCSVFVGGLSWDTTSETLRDILAKYNAVDANVQYDRNGERSRGYGTAMFNSAEDAEAAIAGVDGMNLDGRQIFAKVDRKA